MQAQHMMTPNPACCTPEDTARDAARLMRDHHCGCLPVVEDLDSMRLIGVVTDRDLTMRALAEGKGADTKIHELMSRDPSCCTPDSDVREVQRIMSERQVRRIPVIDTSGSCVGIIAQADLARSKRREISDREVALTVERISEPSPLPRRETDVGVHPAAM